MRERSQHQNRRVGAGILLALLAVWPSWAAAQVLQPEPGAPADEGRLQQIARQRNESSGQCLDSAECFDGLPCTLDLCSVEGLCLNLPIPDCVPCRGKHACSPVDLVFIIDTSGSMRDEASALCASIGMLENEMASYGITLNIRVLGTSQTPEFSFLCVQDNVVNMLGGTVPGSDTCLFPNGSAANESWGPATAIVAENYPWGAGARIIVPIGDEGPCNGDLPEGCNNPGDDRNSVNNAIAIALQNDVVVSCIGGTNIGPCGVELMQILAAGTSGLSFQTKDPKVDLTDALREIVLDVCTIDESCDDGQACTEDDVCRKGICVGREIQGCRLCVTDVDCEDQNACTIGVCAAGRCEYSPTYDPQLSCCNPQTGSAVELSDGDPCTADICDTATGQVIHPPAASGVACDDGRNCTVDDRCNGSGRCTGQDITTVSCDSDDDCLGQVCDVTAGHCMCTENPEVCLKPRAGSLPIGDCVAVGEEVVVDVMLSSSVHTIVGGQFLIGFDPQVFEFVNVEPGSFSDFASPYSFELMRTVNPTTGQVFYAVGIPPGGKGTRGPALLASVTFRALQACSESQFCFEESNPQNNRLADDRGQSVDFVRCCSEQLHISAGAPRLSCPANVSVNAEAGTMSASVHWNAATAVSDCEGPVQVMCTGQHEFGSPVSHLIAAGGVMPSGTTDFSCTAMDSCGAVGMCAWNVEVREFNTVLVDVQFSPSMTAGPLQRCVEFSFYSACNVTPVVVNQTVSLGLPYTLPGRALGVSVNVPAGEYTCVSARDPKHTLRSTAALSIENGKYVADFVGDWAQGGNWLVNGNLDGNSIIDSIDEGILLSKLNTARPSNTPCGSTGFHADFDGNGVVDLVDRAFIQNNVLKTDMAGCCGTVAAVPEVGGLSDNGLEELERMGVDETVADRNGDGVVDDHDVMILLIDEQLEQFRARGGPK